MITRLALTTTLVAATLMPAVAEEVRIVSWNMGPGLYESVLRREADLKAMDAALQPDVLVLIEMAGTNEVREIARMLGWAHYYAAVTDGFRLSTQASFALETAVISKVPITQVIEYDAETEGTMESPGISAVITDAHPQGDTSIPVREAKLLPVTGIDGVGQVVRSDRGTMRVDLANGLSIFPVHLKSNVNAICSIADTTIDNLRRLDLDVLPELEEIMANGSSGKAEEDMLNAVKRERVIAAVKMVADEAVAAGRTVVIAGDYNTSFEDGKFGSVLADCAVTPFSCAQAPFPAASCQDGDGYDDTFAILTAPLVGNEAWTVLTEDLGSTYDDDDFADRAIDHLAVPASQAASFSGADKGAATFGSDHFPIFVTVEVP